MTQDERDTRALIAPAITGLRNRIREAERHTPGGKLTAEERAIHLRNEAKHHGMTPDDLARWAEFSIE